MPNGRTLPREEIGENVPRKVSDLIDNGYWNREMIHECFSPWEAEQIMKIPVSKYALEDRWAWKHTKNGDFTVRSAYFVELKARSNQEASTSNDKPSVLWQNVWTTNTPPKMRNLGWKALHDVVPVRGNLARRGMEIDAYCPLCGEEVETVMHAMVYCREVQPVWYLSPLRLEVGSTKYASFMDWCCELLKIKGSKEWWSIFWSLLWGIWLRRNAWVFKRRKLEIAVVIRRAMNTVSEFEFASERRVIERDNSSKPEQVWQTPGCGTYKVNSDAACFEDGSYGIGGIMRDHEGDVMVAMCDRTQGNGDPEVAEALAARQALSIAIDAGLRNLVLEMDCIKLVRHLKQQKMERTLIE
ncbi:hypothetical protein RDABS01_032412 [Bienertia sinuspersici]